MWVFLFKWNKASCQHFTENWVLTWKFTVSVNKHLEETRHEHGTMWKKIKHLIQTNYKTLKVQMINDRLQFLIHHTWWTYSLRFEKCHKSEYSAVFVYAYTGMTPGCSSKHISSSGYNSVFCQFEHKMRNSLILCIMAFLPTFLAKVASCDLFSKGTSTHDVSYDLKIRDWCHESVL